MGVRTQAMYSGAVLSDYVMRTVLASTLTAAMFPAGVVLDAKTERRRLEFYAELGDRRDPEVVFVPPPSPIPVQIRPGEGLSHSGGHVERLRFHSPFEPLNPELRSKYLAHRNNQTAKAQYWRHDDGAHDTLIVIHGFGASPAAFNANFFTLPAFFKAGWDIVLFTLPFHGGRRGDRAPFNGAEFFARGFTNICEAMAQAICDLRVLLDFLDRKGAPRVGVTGLSLGGYTTALFAEVEDRLDFAIPNAPVTSMPELIDEWFPANLGITLMESVKGIPRELLSRAAALHSPLSYPPKLPKDRLMVIGGRGDRMAPPSQAERLWEHWQRPELHWFPGSHILHFSREDYLTEMRRLMGRPSRATAAHAQPERQAQRQRST